MIQERTSEKGLSARSEAFVMRFEPRVKYLAELAARRERRSLTNFIEWAIEQALKGVPLRHETGKDPQIFATDSSNLLWDLDEVERLRKLERQCPDLLSYEEQRILALISQFGAGDKENIRFKVGDKIDWARVKACWPEIKAYASGKCDEVKFIAAVRSKCK